MLDFVVELLLGGWGHVDNLRDDDAPEATRAPRWLKWLLLLVMVGAIAFFAWGGGIGWLWSWL